MRAALIAYICWTLNKYDMPNINPIPLKVVEKIRFAPSSPDDSSLPIASFDRSELIAWLESFTAPKVSFYFAQEEDGTVKVIARATALNGSMEDAQKSGPNLPCPPYCKY